LSETDFRGVRWWGLPLTADRNDMWHLPDNARTAIGVRVRPETPSCTVVRSGRQTAVPPWLSTARVGGSAATVCPGRYQPNQWCGRPLLIIVKCGPSQMRRPETKQRVTSCLSVGIVECACLRIPCLTTLSEIWTVQRRVVRWLHVSKSVVTEVRIGLGHLGAGTDMLQNPQDSRRRAENPGPRASHVRRGSVTGSQQLRRTKQRADSR
jgi:hypothetical protein